MFQVEKKVKEKKVKQKSKNPTTAIKTVGGDKNGGTRVVKLRKMVSKGYYEQILKSSECLSHAVIFKTEPLFVQAVHIKLTLVFLSKYHSDILACGFSVFSLTFGTNSLLIKHEYAHFMNHYSMKIMRRKWF